MVSLDQILASNARISKDLPPGLVGVFVGATKGIGLTTVKAFARHTVKPKVYIVGRSVSAGEQLVQDCQKINPQGEYTFISKDVSLLRGVDEVCEEIQSRESAVNLLFCSQGTMKGRTETTEGLHFLVALTYYSRIRFAFNLLPLIQKATTLRSVQFVFAGTKEGPLDTTDYAAMRVSLMKGRGHMASMNTLGLEMLAKQAPNVRFVHNFPGAVKTELLNHDVSGVGWKVMQGVVEVMGWLGRFMDFDEAGERQLWFATSGRFAGGNESRNGVAVEGEKQVCKGSDGKVGSGVYTIDQDGECADGKVLEVLRTMRDDGTAEGLWTHTTAEFARVTGKPKL